MKGFKTAKALGLDVPSQAAARARQSATLPPRRRITFPGLGNNRIWLSTQAIQAGILRPAIWGANGRLRCKNSEPRMSAWGQKHALSRRNIDVRFTPGQRT